MVLVIPVAFPKPAPEAVRMAVEYGFRAAEKGLNLQAALELANKMYETGN